MQVLQKDYNISATLLDIDTRFKELKGFHYFDLKNPHYFANKFELIIVDPPFFGISLADMAQAITMISKKKPISLLFSKLFYPFLYLVIQISKTAAKQTCRFY